MIAPEWEVLSSAASLVRPAERWHPRQEDAVAKVAEAIELPLHIADQLYAQMLEAMEISKPLDENSP